MPWFTDAGLLYYRTDLLEKYGFEAPPETWAELEEMATAIQEGESADNPDFRGFVWQGTAYEGLTCDALEWQVSNGGGRIIEPDGTVTVNNPQAIAAFERARGWVGTISPEDVTTYRRRTPAASGRPGNAAFMRNWPYAYSRGQADDSPSRTSSTSPSADGRRRGRDARGHARRLAVDGLQVLAEPGGGDRLGAVHVLAGAAEVVTPIERSHSPTIVDRSTTTPRCSRPSRSSRS